MFATQSNNPFSGFGSSTGSSFFGTSGSSSQPSLFSSGFSFGSTPGSLGIGGGLQQPQQSTFGFGSSSGTTGTSSTSSFGGLFGQPSVGFSSQQASGFGSGNSFFGNQPPQQQSGGPFGSSFGSGFAQPQQPFGTANFKFTNTRVMEQNGATNYQSITALDQYKSKSFEELRFDDYKRLKGAMSSPLPVSSSSLSSGSVFSFSGGSGPGVGAGTGAGTGSGFGSGSGGFNFGTGSSSGFNFFGSSNPTTQLSFGGGGSATGSAFSFGGFTSSSTSTSSAGPFTFGASSSATSSGFNFGGIGGGSGSSSGSGSGGLFSGSTLGGGGFSFGGSGSGILGGGSSGFSFGSTSASFSSPFTSGATTSSQSSTYSVGSLSSGNLFGFSAGGSSSGFNFGSAPSSGSFLSSGTGFNFGGFNFGSSSSSTTPAFGSGGSGGGGGIFSSSTPSSGFNFGNTGTSFFNFGSSTSSTQSPFSFGASSWLSPSGNLVQQSTQQVPQPTVGTQPFGNLPQLAVQPGIVTTTPTLPSSPITPTGSIPKNKKSFTVPHYKLTPRSTSKLKPRGYSMGKMFDIDVPSAISSESKSAEQSFVPRQNVKKLVIDSHDEIVSPLFDREKRAQFFTESKEGENEKSSQSERDTKETSKEKPTAGLTTPSQDEANNKEKALIKPIPLVATPNGTSSTATIQKRTSSEESKVATESPESLSKKSPQSEAPNDHESSPQVVVPTPVKGKPPTSSAGRTYRTYAEFRYDIENGPQENTDGQLVPRVTRPGYSTIPSLDILKKMSADQLKEVVDFTVEREGVGSVKFLGTTDVRGLDIDNIVIFRPKEIIVYPNEERKPPIGEELNKPAIITLYNCWPRDKVTGKLLKDPEKLKLFEEKLKQMTRKKLGGRFISYNPEKGEWTFRVEHFSRYRLDPEDEYVDDDDNDNDNLEVDDNMKDENEEADSEDNEENDDQESETSESENANDVNDNESDADNSVSEESSNFVDSEENAIEEEMSAEDIDESTPPSKKKLAQKLQTKQRTKGRRANVELEVSPIPRFRTSSAVLPQHLGLDPSKIQVMKSFLFHQDDYQKTPPEVFAAPTKRQRTSDFSVATTPSSMISPSPHAAVVPVSAVIPPVLKKPLLSVVKKESPLPHTRPLFVSEIERTQWKVTVPFSESVIHSRTRTFIDSGLFLGRSFRVGWGPCGILFRISPRSLPEKSSSVLPPFAPHQPQDNVPKKTHLVDTVSGRKENRPLFSVITIEKVNPLPLPFVVEGQFHYLPFLEAHLNNIQMERNVATGLPIFKITERASDYVDETIALLEKFLGNNSDPYNQKTPLGTTVATSLQVWKLVRALWGKHKHFDVPNAYVEQLARRYYLTHWLKEVVRPIAMAELNELNLKDQESVDENKENQLRLKAIFINLSTKRVKEAVNLALKNNDYRFALLLAQAGSNPQFSEDIAAQLRVWHEIGAEQYIEKERLEIFRLLASDVNSVLESLDWRRAFAVHLWYGQPRNAPINSAVAAYDKAVMKGLARPPLACSHYKTYGPVKIEGNDSRKILDTFDHLDTCYHLLHLFSNKLHPLNKTLHPLSSSTYPLDHWLSWHLHSVLDSLGMFPQLSNVYDLGMSFAFQLETAGHWEWSIYIILNLPEHKQLPRLREMAIKSFLSRYAKELTAKEQFLTQKLQVPSEWLEEAIAWHSFYNGDIRSAVQHFLKCGKWEDAHHILVAHLINKLILNEECHDEAKQILSILAEHTDSLNNWDNKGGVYFDYLSISFELKQATEYLQESPLKSEEVIRRLLRLEKLVESVSLRLSRWTVEEQITKQKDSIQRGVPSAASKDQKEVVQNSFQKTEWEKQNNSKNDSLKQVVIAEMSTKCAQYLMKIKDILTTLQSHDLKMQDAGTLSEDEFFQEKEQGTKSQDILFLAPQLKSLAIPEDYRFSQLNEMLTQFVTWCTTKSNPKQ